jgi:peptidoglycan endopeptidase LytF
MIARSRFVFAERSKNQSRDFAGGKVLRKVGYVLGLLTLIACSAFGSNKTYTIREGDTVSGIAARFSVRQADLLRANSLGATATLKIGRKLVIPQARAHKTSTASYRSSAGGGYTVRSGDNDWIIARRFSTTEHQLHLANPGVDWNHLKLGLRLNVPAGHGGTSSPVARRVSTASAPHVASASGQAYTVKPDDNDWVIAGRLGITVHKLHDLNPGVNWDRLQIGARLAIPREAAVAARMPAIRSRYAKIARDSVIIRRKPSTSAEKVTTVPSGLLVTVLDRHAGWYELRFPKGTVGWVRGDMLKEAKRPVVAHAGRRHRRSYDADSAPRRYARRSRHSSGTYTVALVTSAPSAVKKVLRTAYSNLGARYTWGRNDCSGFTMRAMRSAGVYLPHSSRGMSRFGRQVGRGQLKPGDLVFFHTGGSHRINHVGIYTGNGHFIHSSSGGGQVQVNSLSEGYYQSRFATARRVLPQNGKSKKKHHKS